MTYDLIPQKFIDKFYDLLATKSIVAKNNGKSPKERFVEKVFHKYIGKYYAYIDKRLGYLTNGNDYINLINKSYLEGSNQRNYFYSRFDKVFFYVKKYGKLSGVKYVMSNKDIGNHIEVYFDSVDACHCYTLNFIENSCFDFQFKEIKKSEYEAIQNLFIDDREEHEFTVIDYKGDKKIKRAKSFSEASCVEAGNWFHCKRPY
jgi:hypothetical protein